MINKSCTTCRGTGTVMIATVIKMDCPVCAQEVADIKADAIDSALDNCAWYHNREFIKCDDIIKYAESLRNK
jgi:methylase of polypeptide subunit release factors